MTGHEEPKSSPSPEVLTEAELSLLLVVNYGAHCTLDELPEVAVNESQLAADRITVAQCKAALASCLTKRWLRVINEADLTEISDLLNQEGVLGPIYGLPKEGMVDFTSEGARRWSDTSRGIDSFVYTDVVQIKKSRYYREITVAIRDMAELKETDSSVSVAGPFPIGPWRVEWWHRYEKGFRIDIEESAKWTGALSQGDSWYLPRQTHSQSSDVESLQCILDQYKLQLYQWMILASIGADGAQPATRMPRTCARAAKRRFGITISEGDCLTALQSCFDAGLVRVVDEAAANELQSNLDSTPELQPLCKGLKIPLGAVDFSPQGATLYGSIASHIFGHDWDKDICVEHECYRKEHRYSQSEEAITKALASYDNIDQQVLSHKIEPIGPWCLRWWKRFPGGFLLEVEIGASQ